MEKKERNKRIGIIAAMVALIILIMCLGGNTFAKYISSKEVPTTSATVAKWGYTVEANAKGLFGEEYSRTQIKTDTVTTAVDVKSDTAGKFRVAPGTKGEVTFSAAGTAEVMSKLTITITSGDYKDSTTGSTKEVHLNTPSDGDYYPIKWTLASGTDGATYGTELKAGKLSEIIDYVSTDSQFNATVAPGTAVTKYYKLSWEWAFEQTTATGTDAEKAAYTAKYNKFDTILGDAAEGHHNGAAVGTPDATTGKIEVADGTDTYDAYVTIELGITVSVEQVQAPAGT